MKMTECLLVEEGRLQMALHEMEENIKEVAHGKSRKETQPKALKVAGGIKMLVKLELITQLEADALYHKLNFANKERIRRNGERD